MKKIIGFMVAALLMSNVQAQDEQSRQVQQMVQSVQHGAQCGCAAPDSAQLAAIQQPIINQTYKLAVVFVDFNDARVGFHPDSAVVSNAQIEQWVGNEDDSSRYRLDAIGSFGYRRKEVGELGNLWKPVVRKYEWHHYWKAYLSRNGEYRDNDAANYHPHPDYVSHNANEGRMKSFGSLAEYWAEVSAGNVNFIPAPIPSRSGQPDSLQGIVNPSEVLADGRRFVKWISMGVTKQVADNVGRALINSPGRYSPDAYVNANIRTLLQSKAAELGFDVGAYLNESTNNKLLVVVAGRTDGGIANGQPGQICTVGEKTFIANWWFASACTFARIDVACHEVGHLLGFAHTIDGAPGGLGMRSVMGPNTGNFFGGTIAHIDVYSKLIRGWVNPIVINQNTASLNLPPVQSGSGGTLPSVGIITLFGMPGASNITGQKNWAHSEYYILENRRRIGFETELSRLDQVIDSTGDYANGTLTSGTIRFTNRNNLLNSEVLRFSESEPSDFNGGLLVTHRVENTRPEYWSGYGNVLLVEADGGYNMSLVSQAQNPLANRRERYTDYFRVGYKTVMDSTTSPSSVSSFNLASGVKLTVQNGSGSVLLTQVEYQAGAPPTYDYLLDDGLYSFIILSGRVYANRLPYSTYHRLRQKVTPGTIIDIRPFSSPLSGPYSGSDTVRWNNITFQGVPCGHYRIPTDGVSIEGLSVEGIVSPYLITNCTFRDAAVGDTGLKIFASPARRILKNNLFTNNAVDISVDNSGSVPTDISDYDKNIFSSFVLTAGKYLITTNFSLPLDATLITNALTAPLEIQFAPNITMTLLGTATMEACGQAASGLRRVKLTRSAAAPWGGLIINETSRFTTLKNVDIEYANTGIQFNGLNRYNPPIITHSRISNSGYGLYVAPYGGEAFRAAAPSVPLNLYIAKSRITQNGTGVYVTGINNVRIDSTNIDSNTVGVECVSASPLIAFSRIANSSQEGMKLNNASPKVGRCTFEANRQAVVAENQSAPDFAYEVNFGSNAGRNRFIAPQTAIPDETYLITTKNSSVTLGFTALGGGYPPPPGPIGTFGFNSLNAPFHLDASKESSISANNCYFDQDPPVTLTDESSSIFVGALETEPSPIGWGLDTNTTIYATYCPPPTGGGGCSPCNGRIATGGNVASTMMMSAQTSNMNSVVWQSATMQVITADSLIAEINRAKLTGQWNETGRLITEIGEQLSNGTQGASVNSVQMAPLLVDNGIPKLLRRALGALVSLSYLVGNQVQECQTNLQSVRAIPDFASNHFDLAVIEAVVELNVRKDFARSRQIAAELQAQIMASGLSGNGNTAIERSHRWLKQTILQYQKMRSRIANLPAQVIEATSVQSVGNTQASVTDEKLPKSFTLSQNYPNPFNPSTNIKYALPRESKVALRVYDVLGRAVTTLVNQAQKAGYYEVRFDASRLATGIYFYRIQADGFVQSKKMLLVK